MEKIVIGVPYEISIEPSIDIGKFDAELVICKDDFQVGIMLNRIKGKDTDYSFIIPSKLKTLLKKSDVDYCIYVYKENARFEVDDGKLKFIDESDFKVKVTDNAKMRRSEEEAPKPTKKAKKKATKPTPTPTPSDVAESHYTDPADVAQALIDEQGNMESVVEPIEVEESIAEKPVVVAKKPPVKLAPSKGNLGSILNKIETIKSAENKRNKINETIRKAIKSEPND